MIEKDALEMAKDLHEELFTLMGLSEDVIKESMEDLVSAAYALVNKLREG